MADFALLAPQATQHTWYPFSFLAPPAQNEPWLSDALCRLATGGGFATRELYSNEDEVIFDALRGLFRFL